MSDILTASRPIWRHLDVQYFDIQFWLSLLQHLGLEVQLVKIGTSLSKSFDLDEPLFFEFLYMRVHALS